ncbi:MAG: cyclopropane fatty acyl phospholipid synthase [Patescibacteria group bacterium]
MQSKVTDLLAQAGITVNGSKSTDIQVYDKRFYREVFARGRLGIGESFMRGDWDVKNLPYATYLVLKSNIDKEVRTAGTALYFLRAQLTNMQRRSRALDVAQRHYNAGNDLFRAMLGPTMTYSCGYWRPGVKTLEQAQDAKHDLVCRRVKLEPGQRILDIGCGWGGFLKFAAENYGIFGVGIANSEEQVKLARERVRGLPVRIELRDWRDIDGKFDHVVSIGMFEHVGKKNYPKWLEMARDRCKDEKSLIMLHTIVSQQARWLADPWFEKYIFPGGFAPAIEHIARATWSVKGDLLEPLHLHNIGRHYSLTLKAWFYNLVTHWPALEPKYGPMNGTFFRMMRYYLNTMEGAFDVGRMQLIHLVMAADSSAYTNSDYHLRYEPVFDDEFGVRVL